MAWLYLKWSLSHLQKVEGGLLRSVPMRRASVKINSPFYQESKFGWEVVCVCVLTRYSCSRNLFGLNPRNWGALSYMLVLGVRKRGRVQGL